MKKIKTTVCIITAVLALTLALPAHAEGFRQGDKSDEIAAVQSVLKSKKLYSGEVNGLFDRLTASAVEKMQQTAEYSLKNDSDFFNGMLFGSINGQNSIAAANGTDSLAGTDTDDGTGSPDEIKATMADLAARRREKQPLQYPSCGSFFKRPVGYYAGALIEQAGLKGYRVGDAQVSEMHAGFVINRGHATSSEIYRLMQEVQCRVQAQFGVTLEPEVRLIGHFEA